MRRYYHLTERGGFSPPSVSATSRSSPGSAGLILLLASVDYTSLVKLASRPWECGCSSC